MSWYLRNKSRLVYHFSKSVHGGCDTLKVIKGVIWMSFHPWPLTLDGIVHPLKTRIFFKPLNISGQGACPNFATILIKMQTEQA